MQGSGGRLKVEGKIENDFLVISDTGRGIKEESQELVLEPFFSTKPEVEGAGLWLSVAYGTMNSIGGQLLSQAQKMKVLTFLFVSLWVVRLTSFI